MTRAVTGPARVDSPAQRFVRSRFNDPGVAGLNVFTATCSTTSQFPVEMNSAIRVEFLAWSGEIVQAVYNGTHRNTTAWEPSICSFSFDGTTPEDTFVTYIGDSVSDYGNARGYVQDRAERGLPLCYGGWAAVAMGAALRQSTMLQRTAPGSVVS